ncbi:MULTISPECIES: response regulator transcription factor [Microbacterium]|uniref:DNA-binding response OmpR family regulator n=1 Tax=Microbacterium kyungheense TaxID=1263636 RepID=A0A543F0M4_9MICO|nr:response regulator transcription factor [Microbacterium kyungheense]TQM27378.1 DNA-binding response OmpR family regulator [Microbacterium kyungheense]
MRVLIVEDERRLAEGMKRGLEAEGFAVDIAATGTDGLWLAEQQPYAAIVLDLMLPGASGFEVCRRLRQQSIWTPVLVVTAKDGVFDEVEALESGADDYLTKPYTFAILVARLRALIRRGSSPRPRALQVGDLTVDPFTRRVDRAGQVIELTAREFAVLEFLCRRPGQVVGKRAILDGVWDFGFDGDPNIVEVYIRHLRNKVDRPFGRESIETLRGAGYRMVDDAG